MSILVVIVETAYILNMYEFEDVMAFLQTEDNWNKFDTLCIDSLSEVAEVCLLEQKEKL